MIKAQTRQPSLFEVLGLFGVFAILMYMGAIIWKVPTVATLFVSTFIFTTYGMFILGVPWQKIQEGIITNIAGLIPAFLILLIVGSLIGTWMISGVIPLMIYYGLHLLEPSYFLVASTIICCIVSLAAGTSWGTLSTVGIALMGVAAGLDISLPLAAGAIVVGAFFGDKMSPLSDTVNVAAAVSEANLFEHIKYLLYTTLPALFISLIIFFIYDSQNATLVVDTSKVNSIINGLQAKFNLSPILLLPPIVTLVLIARKTPVLPVLAISSVLAGLLALFVQQGVTISELLTVLHKGYSAKTGIADVDRLLTGGGINSMSGTIILLIAAISVGGTLRSIGVLDVCLNILSKYSNTPTRLIFTTQIANILIILFTGSCYLSMSLVGPMFTSLYDKLNLARVNLSRTLEDSGTVIVPIVPWGITGVFVAKTLGVPVLDYLPYAPLCYLSGVMAIILASLGWLRPSNNICSNHNENKEKN